MSEMTESNPSVAQVLLPDAGKARLPETQPGALEELRRGLAREL